MWPKNNMSSLLHQTLHSSVREALCCISCFWDQRERKKLNRYMVDLKTVLIKFPLTLDESKVSTLFAVVSGKRSLLWRPSVRKWRCHFVPLRCDHFLKNSTDLISGDKRSNGWCTKAALYPRPVLPSQSAVLSIDSKHKIIQRWNVLVVLAACCA